MKAKDIITTTIGVILGILIFYLFGLIGALVVLLIAFGYKQYKKKKNG